MSNNTTTPHYFLSLHPYYYSNGKAETTLDSLLQRIGLTQTEINRLKKGNLVLQKIENREINLSYRQLIAELRKNGMIESIDIFLDAQDPIFGKPVEMETNSSALQLTVNYLDYTRTVQGPGRLYIPEHELAYDILYYRQKACEFSSEPTFATTARYARAYLTACVSLVEAFINRHIWIADHQGLMTPDFVALKQTRRTDEKIELWCKVFLEKEITAINNGIEWDNYQRLRQERNKLIHVVEPYYSDTVEDMARRLNYVRAGVGGMLNLLRTLLGLPLLSFMRRLETAPEIRFVARKA